LRKNVDECGRPSRLPAFARGFTHTVLDMGLAGDLDFLSLVVFVHMCDTIPNPAEISKWNVGSVSVLTVSFPTVVRGDLPTAYFRHELGRISRFLEIQRDGEIDDNTIRAIWPFTVNKGPCYGGSMPSCTRIRRSSPVET